MTTLKKLVQTPSDVSLLILRVALGIMIFPHGAQKVLGWFSGPGPEGATQFLTGLGAPAFLVPLVFIVEFLGGIALLLGLLGRLAALGLAFDMLGAILLFHLPMGFFAANGGYEFHLVTIAAAIVLVLKGSGAASVDRLLAERLK